MYQWPSCLTHPFRSDGSSTGLLALCLQTDSNNWNTQWPGDLCQYCWSQSYHLLSVESININSLLSVFIAWLNLDFGIETCFYNGMDAYSKTWLQFVFPVYIWVLVGLVILISHFSRRFAKLLGNNPVSVLATLILLSYTKILHTLIAAIHITYLEYPTYNRSVWLYDANIDYLVGKCIPLFLVAGLVFFVLFLALSCFSLVSGCRPYHT